MTVGGMCTKYRNPAISLRKALLSVLLVFAALLPAFPASANSGPWSDSGTSGAGGNDLTNAGAGRGVICRMISPGSYEGWGVMVDSDRMATSAELNLWLTPTTAINVTQDSSRLNLSTVTVRGTIWTWVKGSMKWIEPKVFASSHGLMRQYGGPNGQVWTWVIPGNGGFNTNEAVWVRRWFQAPYANCDPVRCPGGSCTSTRTSTAGSVKKFCLNDDAFERRSTAVPTRQAVSNSLEACHVKDSLLTARKICQTHWEVWRFYGEKGNPAAAYMSGSGKASYSVSRIPLLASGDCALPQVCTDGPCPPNPVTRNETLGVFLSPHPWDAAAGQAQVAPGSGVFDSGYASVLNGLSEPVLHAPIAGGGASKGYTTLPPFRQVGSCTTLVSPDSPYAGSSETAKQLRASLTSVIAAQGYGAQFTRLAANEDAAGNWEDGVPCTSGAEFARPFDVIATNDDVRPVYGTCWVPVWQARFGQTNTAGVVSYSFRDDYLFRYGASSRPVLKVSGSVQDIDRFTAYARTQQGRVVVVSVDLAVQPNAASKTVYITSVGAGTTSSLQALASQLWLESAAQSDARFKVTGGATGVAAAGSGDPGLEHHAAWRTAIGQDVTRRFTAVGSTATITGSGVGLPVGRNFSNQNWVPADPYATSNDTSGTSFIDTWASLRSNATAASTAAQNSAVCVDGPLASGDATPVVAPAAQVEIASKVTLPSTTINPAWSIGPCEPAESEDEKVRDESAAACAEFGKLSAADKAKALNLPSTSQLAQKKFDAYIIALLTKNPAAPIPASVDLGEVARVEYVSPRNPSARGTIAISAVVNVDVDSTKCPPGSTLAECLLKKCPPGTTLAACLGLPDDTTGGVGTDPSPGTPDSECPGPCHPGTNPSSLPRVSDRPSALVTLVVPRTFATGAGMTSKQKVTAVVHNLDDAKVCAGYVGASTGKVVAGNTGASDVITGCRPMDHEMTMRLALSAVGNFSQMKVLPSSTANNTVLSGCSAALLRSSFEANYASTACSRSFEMEFYRASVDGDGAASTVSASGRISRQVMVTIRYPRACLAQIVQDINALLGSVDVSTLCNFPNDDGITRDMSIAEYAIPGWRNLGWAGIGFTVRVVFEEDVANSYAHDSLLTACGNAPKAPSLSGSLCTLRPVISTSATGKR